MTLVDDYNRWENDLQQQNARAANVVIGTIQEQPDQVANDMRLASDFAKITGKPQPPLSMVGEYRGVFQQQIEAARNTTILSKAPRLTEWLRDPQNAAVARDDLSNLSWWEGMGRAATATGKRAWSRIIQGRSQLMLEQTAGRARDRKLTFGELLDDERRTGIFDTAGKELQSRDGSEYIGAFTRWLDARYADLIGTDDQAAAQSYAEAMRQSLEAIKLTPKSLAAQEFENAMRVENGTFGEVAAAVGKAIIKHPLGAMAWALETAGESAPQMAAALGVGAVTRSPAAGIVTMGGGSYLTERYTSPAEFFMEKGLSLGKPEDVQKLLSNPKLMREAAERGVIRGTIIGLFDAFSGGVAGRALARNPLVEALAQSMTQMVMGSGGEYAARVAAGQEIDWNEIFAEGLGEFATTPVDMATAGRRFMSERGKVNDATTAAQTMQNIVTQAQESALRNRSPDAFRDFVARALEGGPTENIYIPAESFSRYFQSLGVNPHELVDTLEGVTRDDLDAALAAGGDLQIPTATYAAKIAGSEHDAFLLENMRFDPNEFTAAEAREFNERAQEILEEAWDAAEAARQETESLRSFEDEIRDTIISRLRAAGRSTDVATTEAMLYPAFYQHYGARNGMTPDEFMQRYVLPRIEGALPQGMQFRNVDEFARTLAEARMRKASADRRKSLLEFIAERGGIDDPGGELRARDAEVIKRPGKKSLRLARGKMSAVRDMFGGDKGRKFGVDSVAQAAIEAGYLADDPVAQGYQAAMVEGREVPDITRALWSAIDRELAGERQFSSHDQEGAKAAERETELDGIEQYLAGLGVALTDDDATIRAAVENDQAGRQYAQASNKGKNVSTGPDGRTLLFDRIADDWRNHAERILSGAAKREMTVLREFPILEAVFGVRGKVSFNPLAAQKIRADHPDIPDHVWRNLPDLLIDPAFIYQHRDGGLNVVIDATTAAGSPIVVGIRDGQVRTIYPLDGNADETAREHLGRVLASAMSRHENKIYVKDDAALGAVPIRTAASEPGSSAPVVQTDLSRQERKAKIVTRADVVKARGRIFYQDSQPDLTPGGGSKEFHTGNTTITYGVSRDGQTAEVILIETPRDARGQGSARKAMTDLLAAFDRAGITVFLTPHPMDKGVTKGKLSDFYKSLGFRPNKGGKKDFRSQAAMVREPSRSFEQSGPTMRGSIQIPTGGVENGESVIRLFENADLSTFVHETGHFFLTVMQDLAARGENAAADDLATVKDWWRENAADVARDGMRAMTDVKLTADDVIMALDRGTTGDVMKDAAIDVGMQEQFARGFEAYLMEGKAPSEELRSTFEKFRAWLISIYQKLAGLNVKINDDLRGVFDRMLAGDNEIARASEETGGSTPIFATAEQMGLTPDEFTRFMKLREQAENEAKARLLRETMAPVKRAREKWFKEERAAVRSEVERNVNTYRFFRAFEWMANRRWLGEGKPGDLPDLKLSKDVLVERYGEGVLKTLPRGKQAVYTPQGGLDPDDVAGWFGFGSGDELVRALETMPNRNEAIDAETDRVMRERHGDVLSDGSIEAAALDAVHTDKRGQWIAAELKAVADVMGVDVALTAKEARASARQTINRMRVRDAIAANRFLAAERKAADEAAKLGAQLARDKVYTDAAHRKIANKARAALRGDGDPEAVAGAIEAFNERLQTTQSTYTVEPHTVTTKDGRVRQIKGGERTVTNRGYNDLAIAFVEAKRRQLLNHALYMEARNVADEVEKAESYVTRLGKASTRERIAGAGRGTNAQIDYLGAIDDILERYDFRRMSGAAEDRRGKLTAYVEAMKAAGRENELAIPDHVLEDAGRKPYKTIPVEELRGVIESLKNLEHVAKRWDKLIDAEKERQLDAATDEIVQAFDANVKKRPPGRVATKGEGLRNAGRQFFDLVLNATTILREIDGFKDMGAAYRHIKAPIDAAMNRLIARKEKAAVDLEKLYSVYSKDERRAMSVREHSDVLGFALSKWERIAIALNMGNDGNRQRLTDPKVRGSFTDAQVTAILATLDGRDADFVQSVWDYVDTFRADLAARERRATGIEPEWVEPTPVIIAGKTLRGGYYPLKYDPRLSSLARDDDANDIAQSIQAGRFGKAQTRNGHLKERAKSSGRDVSLDMAVLHRHVNQVIYDLELSEAVANSWRVLQDGRVRSAFMEAGKQADFDALEIWLKDVAEGEVRSSDFVGRGARMLKSNFTAAKLAFNLSTVLLQVTGLVQSMVVVGKKDMAVGVAKAMSNPVQVQADIAAKSAYMRTRQTTFNKDIYDFYSDPQMGPVASRWGDIKKEILGPLSFWLMTKVQYHIVDVPTWLAGYQQGLRKFGNDEAKAIAHADDLVKRAQASGLFSDRSAVERGSVSRTARQNDVVRLFTALGSYMFAKANVAYERSVLAQRVISNEGVSLRAAQEALSWSLDMAFLFTVEAVLMAAIKGGLPKDDDDEKKDGWVKFLAKQTGLAVMGTIPFVRDVAGPLQGYDGGGAYGSITKEAGEPFKQMAQGEVDKALIRSVVNLTGLVTGLPSTQMNRIIDASARQSDGEEVSPLEYLLGRVRK